MADYEDDSTPAAVRFAIGHVLLHSDIGDSSQRAMVWGNLAFELPDAAQAAYQHGIMGRWGLGGRTLSWTDLEWVAAGLSFQLDTADSLRAVLPNHDPLAPFLYIPKVALEPYFDVNLDIEGIADRAAAASERELTMDHMGNYEESPVGVRTDILLHHFLEQWAWSAGVDLDAALSPGPYTEDDDE
ncbi:hypothetical protein JCM3775_001128 [Rhodotorula graminis]